MIYLIDNKNTNRIPVIIGLKPMYNNNAVTEKAMINTSMTYILTLNSGITK